MAPRNPEPPETANAPPTKPAVRAGLSPILYAIYAPKIGINRPNAAPPISINNFAIYVVLPRAELPAASAAPCTPASLSNKNASAINIPPLTTNGSINDTPVIKCL